MTHSKRKQEETLRLRSRLLAGVALVILVWIVGTIFISFLLPESNLGIYMFVLPITFVNVLILVFCSYKLLRVIITGKEY